MSNQKKSNGWALLPFAVFIVIYLGAGIILQNKGVEMAFYQFPAVVAMFFAVLVAFAMNYKAGINANFSIFAKGAANEDVMAMLMIYLLAGAFSAVAGAMGGVDATVNLGVSIIPASLLTAGLFVIAAFLATATGTSMGTIGALVPIALGVVDKAGLSLPLVMAAVVSGAMFGDNLSMISDTTIAATRTQKVELKDKFRTNFWISFPAAIVTIVLLIIFGPLPACTRTCAHRNERICGTDYRYLCSRNHRNGIRRYHIHGFRSQDLGRFPGHDRGVPPVHALRRYC